MNAKKKVTAENIIDNFNEFDLLKPLSGYSTLAYSLSFPSSFPFKISSSFR